ncbi:methyltransferase [Xenorhabdus taiwanensis]|uniref:O-methyltransferase n=1 Tax=Xenorhabdus taiwanensis TaxID=3085177 RepID=A0ABM8JU58_9GAMM|nr:O-methyltransferase [Xenorhabdus sp. TCT-1]
MNILNNNTANSNYTSAALHLLNQTMGYSYQAALRAAAVLGVADHLSNGPKTVNELAKTVGAQEQQLHRVLRLLATRNIFHETEDKGFSLTPAAEFLRKDTHHSLRAAVLMLTDRTFWQPLGEIVESVRGNPAFKHLYGLPFFDYWAQTDTQSDDFHVGMSSMSKVENLFLVHSYDFPKNATVVDIAGGFGGLLLEVLQANTTLRGVLFDQPHVLARHELGELGDDTRWEIASGDFFESCPQGDIYLLKYIMHDWSDEQCIQILRNCRQAMSPDGRILVMDPVIPNGNVSHAGKEMDLLCMGVYEEGRERTEDELRQLLANAGLKLNRVIDTGCHISIVEAIAE